MTEFAGRNVLVTGAGHGIGRLMAEEIADRGARAILWDVDGAALAEVVAGIEERGRHASGYVCDVSDRAAVRETAERVLSEHGPVDVLINNAGVVSGRPLLELPDEAIERTFGVNALALFWTTRAFLPAMIEKGDGHVVTIASAAGLVGTARQTDYCASKHAAVGFDDSLRVELRVLGLPVRTTVVCPYYIGTGMFQGVRSRVLPIHEPERAARAIVKAIRRDRRRLFLPGAIRWIYLGRLFPIGFFDAIMRALGVHRTMDAFRGRTGA